MTKGMEKDIALRGNRTPGGSKYVVGNDPGYYYPINAWLPRPYSHISDGMAICIYRRAIASDHI